MKIWAKKKEKTDWRKEGSLKRMNGNSDYIGRSKLSNKNGIRVHLSSKQSVDLTYMDTVYLKRLLSRV